jgi:hypothetical protein
MGTDEGASGDQPATLKRPGKRGMLEPFKEFLLGKIKERVSRAELLLELRERGFTGSRQTLQRFLRATKARILTATDRTQNWMHLVLQGATTNLQIKKDVGDALTDEEITTLLKWVRTKPLKGSQPSACVACSRKWNYSWTYWILSLHQTENGPTIHIPFQKWGYPMRSESNSQGGQEGR